MTRVTLKLDADTAERLTRAARAAGISRSRWIAEILRRRLASEWPEAVLRLAGAWADAPGAEKLRQYQAKDVRRERF